MTKTMSEQPILTLMIEPADGPPGRMSTWGPEAPLRHLTSEERTATMITPKPLTPIKAIRAKCLDCCAGQRKEVHLCHLTDCSLHPYRLGRRPTFPATTMGLAASFARSDGAED